MKKLLITLTLLLTLQISKAAFVGAELKVTGVTCSMCSNSVLKALNSLPFVVQVDVDLEKTIFRLTFKPGTNVVPDQIKEKVEGAGFSVGELVMDFKFDGLSVTNDFHYPFAGNTYHFVNVKNTTLSDIVSLTFVDKGFTSAKMHKKYVGLTTYGCIKTGRMESCCTVSNNNRIYHVTL
jgi:copper chaperone CopZ